MNFLQLQIPPGLYRNGTDYQASGRWRDANLVRFAENSLRPVGGWRQRGTIDFGNAPRASLAWKANDGSRRVVFGFFDRLLVMNPQNLVTDITPSGFNPGQLNSTLISGYGIGPYGLESYGTPRQDNQALQEATVWSLDTWGQNLVGCTPDDGKIYEWALSISPGPEIVVNGEFAADSDWTKGTGWTIAAGVATFSGDQVGEELKQSYTAEFTAGTRYLLEFTVVLTAPADVRVKFDGDVNIIDEVFDTSGTYTIEFVADDPDGDLIFELGTATGNTETFTIDDVSIRQQPAAVVIANAPVDNSAIMVTEERFLFAFGAGGNPRKVQWSDREDNTAWTPTTLNQAGDFELQTRGIIYQGIRTRGQALILTDQDAHTATYQGPPFVYGFERVGTSCGLIARGAAVPVDIGVFWMGQRGFHLFSGGAVQDIPCEVADYVFSDLNFDQRAKIKAVLNSQWNEIWWFYPSSDSNENNRYVSYDFMQRIWTTGNLDRTTGVDRGVFVLPFWVDPNGVLYEHEISFNYHGLTPFCESGPISLGAGDQVMAVRQIIPDERNLGDVTATFQTRFFPTGQESQFGPFQMINPTSVRFVGRQVRMRVTGNSPSDWRVGIMRLDVVPGGQR
jgi:hypothetical protein